jgi:MFS family permease
MMMELNFINLGGLILGILAVTTKAWSSSESLQKVSLGVAILIVLVILFIARQRTPESLRWLDRHGQRDRVREEAARYYGVDEGAIRAENALLPRREAAPGTSRGPALGLRLYVMLAIAFAGSAGFGLMTYTLGPFYFKNLTADIILVAAIVGFVSGFFGLFADRLSRRWLLMVGYTGSFLATIVIFLTVGTWSKSLALFWTLLVVLNLFVNVAYLTEDTLKSEVWPTHLRGTLTAVVRFVSIGLYIPTIYIALGLSLRGAMLFNMLIWAIGLSGALLWYYRGSETGAGVTIDEASADR